MLERHLLEGLNQRIQPHRWISSGRRRLYQGIDLCPGAIQCCLDEQILLSGEVAVGRSPRDTGDIGSLGYRGRLSLTQQLPGRLYDLGAYPGLTEARTEQEWVLGDVYELAEPENTLAVQSIA